MKSKQCTVRESHRFAVSECTPILLCMNRISGIYTSQRRAAIICRGGRRKRQVDQNDYPCKKLSATNTGRINLKIDDMFIIVGIISLRQHYSNIMVLEESIARKPLENGHFDCQ
ncbi:hypothetical protein CDAR_310521 [Caerostris darwini]|uniref:Uncharacterized protein n=1 Tax=Caerostris darwini TaxID=1538125 RepID=A0AAV4R387_9ARAC|nr:hypothetical protein CDAR_310521 [Caerostris darwini]